MPIAAIIHYIDIDAPSWKWGDIRKTSLKDNLSEVFAHMETHGGSYHVLCGHSAGNYKYHGFHGLMSAADTLCAAGTVSEDAGLICIKDDSVGWLELVDKLIEGGASPLFTHGACIDDEISGGFVGIDPKASPPSVSLDGVRFSELGRRRLATARRWRLLKAFSTASGITVPENEVSMPAMISNELVRGWWDEYESLDRFGSWTLAKADVSIAVGESADFAEMEQIMHDVGAIWQRACEEQNMSVKKISLSKESAHSIIARLPVMEMLDAYRSGVPLEDILA